MIYCRRHTAAIKKIKYECRSKNLKRFIRTILMIFFFENSGGHDTIMTLQTIKYFFQCNPTSPNKNNVKIITSGKK